MNNNTIDIQDLEDFPLIEDTIDESKYTVCFLNISGNKYE